MTVFSIIFIIMIVIMTVSFLVFICAVCDESSDIANSCMSVFSFFCVVVLVMWFVGTHKGVKTTITEEQMKVVEHEYKSYSSSAKEYVIKEKADYILHVEGSLKQLSFPTDYGMFTTTKNGDIIKVRVTCKYRPLFDSTKITYELITGE